MRSNHQAVLVSFAFLLATGGVAAQNIGINNDGSAGSTLLHTKNTAAATDNILRIENTIATQRSGINLLNSGTANSDWLFYVPASSTDLRLQLYTGVDAVTFLNTGKVGIGTTTPTGPLSVVSTSTSANYHDRDVTVFYYPNNGVNSGGFSVYKARGTAAAPTTIVNGDFTGRISFGAHDGTAWVSSAHIAAIVNGAVATGSVPQDLTFRTGTSGAGTEYMRLLSTGNFGVGTSAPISKLHSAGNLTVGAGATAGSVTNVQITADGVSPIANRLTFGTDGTGWKFAIGENQGGTVSEFMTFQDNGNIGIGTTSPNTNLMIEENNTDVLGALKISQAGTGDASMFFGLPAVSAWALGIDNSDGDKFKISNDLANADVGVSTRLTIDNSGNVGIGSSAPLTKLEVFDGNFSIRAGTTFPDDPGDIIFNTNGGAQKGRIWVPSTAATGLNMNGDGTGTAALSIDANAKVGIGTTAPGELLEIKGTATGIYMNSATSNLIRFNTSGVAVPSYTTRSAGTKLVLYPQVTATTADYALGIAGSTLWYSVPENIAGYNHRFYGGTSELMRIRGDGNVGIGTTAPDTKLHVAGGNGTTLKIVDGNQAAGKVLTSDAAGVASWANPSAEIEFPPTQISNQFWAGVNWNTCVINCRDYNGSTAGDGGYTDWRTPDLAEYLYAKLNFAAPSGGWQGVYFWTRDPDVTLAGANMEIFQETANVFGTSDIYTSTFNKCRCVR